MVTVTLKDGTKFNADTCFTSFDDRVEEIDQFYLLLTEEDSKKLLSYYRSILTEDNLSDINVLFDNVKGNVHMVNCMVLELVKVFDANGEQVRIFITNNENLVSCKNRSSMG